MKTITKFFAIVAISLASVSAFAQPTTLPTAPTKSASLVKSIYNSSSTYTDVTVSSWYPNWASTNVAFTDYTVLTKKVKSISLPANVGGSFGAIDFNSEKFDATNYTNLHFDYFIPTIPTGQVLDFKLSNWKGQASETNAIGSTYTSLVAGSWQSVDIPLANFTNYGGLGLDRSAIAQMIITCANAGSSPAVTFYFDNIYFWGVSAPTLTVSTTAVSIAQPASSTGSFTVTATQNWTAGSDQTWLTVAPTSGTSAGATVTCTATANTGTASRTATVTVTGTDNTVKTVTVTQAGLPIPSSPTPTSAASDVLSVYSDTYTATATNVQFQNWFAAPWTAVTLASGGSAQMIGATADGSAAGIQFDNLDVSAMSFVHFDVYPTTGTTSFIKYNVVPVGGGGAGWSFFTGLIANQWNQVNVPVSTLGLPGTSVFQIGFGTFGGFGTFYVDNIFFSKTVSALHEVASQNGIKCYPSVVSDKLTINSNTEMSQIVVRNLLGQTIKDMNANGVQQIIDMNGVTSGNYLVTVKLANGTISNLKFIKL